MNITRKCPITGITTTKNLPIDPDKLFCWEHRGMLIQEAFPDLSPEDREFIKTGILPETWDKIFGAEG